MKERIYRCSWCNKICEGHPDGLDYKTYQGSYRSYKPILHYYFCEDCLPKVIKFFSDNKFRSEKVIRISDEKLDMR